MFLIRVGQQKTGSYSFSRAKRVGKNISQSNGTVKNAVEGQSMTDDEAIAAALAQFQELKGTTAEKVEIESSEMTIVARFI
ncbi:MAG: hypothetical protein IPJ61_19995 [Tessaracoccus sp.]|uniref:hypothetical protein n=1 Tax=Tessaracoccus sp. TaxID=1971211 RepID=UPI001EB86A94|nr:hypothetical protein [Tessaracoccus sp.]MBK7823269.1 hypothetical protein [Tessaracoccus sp.]